MVHECRCHCRRRRDAGVDAAAAAVRQVDPPGTVDAGTDVAADAPRQDHDQLAGPAADVDGAAVEGLGVGDAG